MNRKIPYLAIYLPLIVLAYLVEPLGCQPSLYHLTVVYEFSFGGEGEAPGQFRHPEGLSTDIKGNIYIADTGNNRIQKFDSRGRPISFIGGFGWASEQFQRPVDIYADKGLNVYVADYENHRIELYDKDLHWISSFYSQSSWEEKVQFSFPRSVCLSIHNELFITDGEHNRILKFNDQKEPEMSFGDFDWGEGGLTEPSQLYITRNDQVLVSDQGAGCIRIYDYYGNFLFDIGGDVLSIPKGLAANREGIIFVADAGESRVVVFDSAGRMVAKIGAPGDKLGAFQNPSDVALVENRLFVLDTDNNRVQVFTIEIVE
jgi:tripartite motif-containing protein 71